MTRVARPDLAEQLRLVAEYAPKLREAGVRSFAVADGCSFTLAEVDVTPGPQPRLDQVADDNSDPLFDPASYPDGKVPGYRLVENLDDVEDPS